MKRIISTILFSWFTVAVTSAEPIKLLVVGDSTASEYKADVAPRTGWGQVFQEYFDPAKVEVIDGARSGRSSKSYYNEGCWKEYLAKLGEGDYVLIQFGHNDEKKDEERHTDPETTYKEWLTKYVSEARAKGVTPILLTSIQRNSWDGNKIHDTHGGYPPAMRELAKKLAVPLIDMQAETGKLFEELGQENMKHIFLILEPGQSPNYADGVTDNTHLQESGARKISRIAAMELKQLDLPISAWVDVD